MVYRNIETGKLYTRKELEKIYNQALEENPEEIEDNFDGFLRNNTGKHGCLEEISKEEKSVHTVYAEQEDITFIMEETSRTGKLCSLAVVGFYHGVPTEENTELYRGKTKAIYEENITRYPKSVIGKFTESTYNIALVTGKFIYYLDEEECDENACVIIYEKEKFSLLSDNYFAYEALMEDLEEVYKGKIEPEFMSDNLKKNMELLAESGYFA